MGFCWRSERRAAGNKCRSCSEACRRLTHSQKDIFTSLHTSHLLWEEQHISWLILLTDISVMPSFTPSTLHTRTHKSTDTCAHTHTRLPIRDTVHDMSHCALAVQCIVGRSDAHTRAAPYLSFSFLLSFSFYRESEGRVKKLLQRRGYK